MSRFDNLTDREMGMLVYGANQVLDQIKGLIELERQLTHEKWGCPDLRRILDEALTYSRMVGHRRTRAEIVGR